MPVEWIHVHCLGFFCFSFSIDVLCVTSLMKEASTSDTAKIPLCGTQWNIPSVMLIWNSI